MARWHWSRRLDMTEPMTKSGEILLTLNQLLLLHGLYDRPDCIATSMTDWFRSGVPYAMQTNTSLRSLSRGIQSIHRSWVVRQKMRSRVVCGLTERGRAIVERQVPVRIRGVGPYVGLRALRGK